MPSTTINGTSLHYRERGQGLPIVLLHGFPLDSRIFEACLQGLSDRWRVIAPDLRGFGQSKSSDAFTMTSLAEDVHALLESIHARPCILGGVSMGGYVALAYNKRYPSELRGLMLIDSRAEGDTADAKKNREKMADLARTSGTAAVVEQMFPKMLASSTPAEKPQVAQALRQIMSDCPPETIANACYAMRDRDDYTADLPSIADPTLILVGEQDAITPPALAQSMNKAIPQSKLQTIHNAGHMAIMENPDEALTHIRRFAESISQR